MLDERTTDYFPCPVEIGARSLAVEIRGPANEPDLRDGEVAFIDPERTPRHKDFVLVDLEGWPEPRIRQYIFDGATAYLTSTNAQWAPNAPEQLSSHRILGVVVFVGRVMNPA